MGKQDCYQCFHYTRILENLGGQHFKIYNLRRQEELEAHINFMCGYGIRNFSNGFCIKGFIPVSTVRFRDQQKCQLFSKNVSYASWARVTPSGPTMKSETKNRKFSFFLILFKKCLGTSGGFPGAVGTPETSFPSP